MQPFAFLFACLLFCTNPFAQRFPFVHYSPKDGLISNQIRSIHQDSRGRLYFLSMKGMSIYDGSRFTNYTSDNGLNFDIVNTIMEMEDDSLWIVTNNTQINCFVKGRIKKLKFKTDTLPIINHLTKDAKGTLYAATDQGLYFFKNNEFTRLSLTDIHGRDINYYITNLIPAGDYLLIQRDHSLLNDDQFIIYLYNIKTGKVISQLERIFFISQAPDKRIWVSTDKHIMSIDQSAIEKGELKLNVLPEQFEEISKIGGSFLMFDQANICWVSEHNLKLIRVESDGKLTTFTTSSGLSLPYVNCVFRDNEGCTWIATNNTGVDKLINSNFSYYENPFGLGANMNISYDKFKDELLVFSHVVSKAAIVKNEKLETMLDIKEGNKVGQLFATPNAFYGVSINSIYKFNRKGNLLSPELLMRDETDHIFSNAFVDKFGTPLICGRNYLTAIIQNQSNENTSNKEIILRKKLDYFADYANTDSKGNIWVITRSGDIIIYTPDPDDPHDYLKQQYYFKERLLPLSPRSFTFDKNDNLWVGTRSFGITMFTFQNDSLSKQFQITNSSGLSENFITNLTCDEQNQIWACSNSGLDIIKMKNGKPVVENLTKQNDIYQSVTKIVFDKNRTAWVLVTNGLIKITPDPVEDDGYFPTLFYTLITAGKDTLSTNEKLDLSFKQNNLSFSFAATSFLDEHQIMYSYLLKGSNQHQWSDPSNNSKISFIDLHPGIYILQIKASFPADRYPDQMISLHFVINPAWWQTWWFRLVIGLVGIGVIVMIIRFYYRRRMEKQLASLEKQQAIEKERTRIASDMHDDLGAGLSRIKFLSESIGLKKQQKQPIEEDVIKIREYSHEMIDKMGEIVWALNEKNDSLNDLFSYIRVYAVSYLSQNGIECKIELPDSKPDVFVSGEFRRNIYLTIKEALHNVVKHAQATSVTIIGKITNGLELTIRDNGIGFDKNNIRQFSNGITNMNNRIKDIQGKIEISDKEGTQIKVSVPLAL